MAKFCFNCGSPLEGAPRFCPSCGTALNPAPVPSPNTAPPSGATPPPAPQPQPPAFASTQQHLPQQPQAALPSQPPPPAARQMPPQNAYGNHPQGYGQQPYPSRNVTPDYASYGNEPYIPDQGIAATFFRYDNRLNRKRYIKRGLVVFGIYLLAALVLGGLGAVIDPTLGSLMVLLTSLAVMVPSYMLLIRRLHDLDRPGWWAVGGIIPMVNMALSIYALCIPGTVGPNQYGPDPLTVPS